MFYRSQLFVPGNRADRFEKACQAGADLVCIDLEDAVGANDKASARHGVIEWLKQTEYENISLRINALDTEAGQADISALKNSGLNLPFIMIPKAGSAQAISALAKQLPESLGTFFVIIESALGLINADKIFAISRVKLALYGAVDYASDVGCDLSWEAHLYARSKLACLASAFDVTLFDVPHIKVKDLEDCALTTRRAKALGFDARSAIHPAQITPIHAVFTPSLDEIAKAERVIAAYQSAGGNVVLLDGKLIEAPMVKKAERVLAYRDKL